jgi:hypothetical protein
MEMSTEQMVKIGALTANAAIDLAADTEDGKVAGMRLGLLEFLRLHAAEIPDTPQSHDLLAAYRDWLQTAVDLYSTGDLSLIRDYMRRGALLRAELSLAEDEVPAAPALI